MNIKQVTLVLLLGLSFHTLSFAGNRAVKITLVDSNEMLDTTTLQTVKQSLGKSMTEGHITTMITYNHNFNFQNRWDSCIKVATINKAGFNRFINNLRTLAVADTVTYDVKPVNDCLTDNQTVCIDGFDKCLNPNIFGQNTPNSTFSVSDVMARKQFWSALMDILPGKVAMEVKLNEGNWNIDLSLASNVGLKLETKHCSQITTSADYGAGFANITCTIKGNAKVQNKIVGLVRDEWLGTWRCVSDLDDESKFKYASNYCDGSL